LQILLTDNASNATFWLQLGHCQLAAGNLGDALNAYQAALLHTSNRNDPTLWCGLGITYARNRDFPEAKMAFANVLKHTPQFDRLNEVKFRLAMVGLTALICVVIIYLARL
jgi:glucose repression mediator protein